MDILKNAALVYKEMLNKEYLIIGGKNGRLFSNILQFTAEEFKHCIGLHKLKDIPAIYRSSSAALFHQILNDKLTVND
ncbi:MAG: PBECR4 domain-containing protein, partial [Oscillospiraceae bacterium]